MVSQVEMEQLTQKESTHEASFGNFSATATI
jgi:hypothetical protein